MSYIVMRFNEDGDMPSVRVMSGPALKQALTDNYWGPNVKFLTADSNLECESGLLIIRGDIVTPQPKTVTIEYDL